MAGGSLNHQKARSRTYRSNSGGRRRMVSDKREPDIALTAMRLREERDIKKTAETFSVDEVIGTCYGEKKILGITPRGGLRIKVGRRKITLHPTAATKLPKP